MVGLDNDAPVVKSALGRDYLLLWSGQIVSLLGTGVSQVVMPLLVYALTHSPVLTGLAGVCFGLPYLLFSLPVGALLDQWDRKRVLVMCGSGCALSMASIPLAAALGRLGVAQLFIVSAVEGTLFVFFNLAETACLPRVVAAGQLPGASARREGAFITADLVAPAVGAALQSIGRAVPFVAVAASYAAAAVAFRSIKTDLSPRRSAVPLRLRAEIAEGLRWLGARPLIRVMAGLDAGRYFVDFGSTPILIFLAKRLHAPDGTILLLFSCGGVGGILGSLLAPAIQRRFRFGSVLITLSWISALLWPLYAMAPSIAILGLIWAGIALCQPVYDTVLVSYRLPLIPDALQGRVNSVFRWVAFSLQALGAALAGVLIQAAGVVATVLVFSGCTLGLAVVTSANAHVREARPIRVE